MNNKTIYILGISAFYHDSAACIVKDGEIIAAAQEERFIDMLQNLAHELKEADDVIVNISQKSVKQRIAETLLHLEDSFGVDNEGFMIIQLSREDISNIVGTATESCIRMLSELKKEKLITTSGKKIKINDSNTMQKRAEGIQY